MTKDIQKSYQRYHQDFEWIPGCTFLNNAVRYDTLFTDTLFN